MSASCSFLAWVTIQPLGWKRHVPPKCPLTYTGLHIVICQKTELLSRYSGIYGMLRFGSATEGKEEVVGPIPDK
jgi:hypothetical protein